MPWPDYQLNDGSMVPSIAFGTAGLGNGQLSIDRVDQALQLGFNHIDTAQMYRNEEETGIAIRDSGLARSEIFLTTKFSGTGGLDIKTSIKNSLKNLGVSYVDLYLIHHPRLALPDIPKVWKQFEDIKAKGLAKSIGVSNFTVHELSILLESAKVKPVVNQIRLHPYVYAEQAPILEYCAQQGIVIEGYSPLTPLTKRPGGPVDAPLNQIADRLKATPAQVLLAWVKAKGAVPVTTSTKKERLEAYLEAGDVHLTTEDVAVIDAAGALGAAKLGALTMGLSLRGVVAILAAATTLAFGTYVGLNILY